MRQAGVAQYMRPRQLLLYRGPEGPSGKVLKHELRRCLLQHPRPCDVRRTSSRRLQS